MKTNTKLLQACKDSVNDKRCVLLHRIDSLQQSLTSEAKSTAGDKHETGRAMIQLEIEKAGSQLKEIESQMLILNKIKTGITTQNISLGNIVITSIGSYFMSIGLGVITVENQPFYVVSLASPIGALLLGKQSGDNVIFNGKEIKILEVI